MRETATGATVAALPGHTACARCGRVPARSVSCCPFCGASSKPAADEQPSADPEIAGNVIRANFGDGVPEHPPQKPENAPIGAPEHLPSLPTPAQKDDGSAAAPVARPAPLPVGTKRRILLAVAGGLLLALTIAMLPTRHNSPAPPEPAAVTVFALRSDTSVRDAPTTVSSNVTSKLERGTVVTGIWQPGSNGRASWLKITSGPHQGNFVWERNLSTSPPPALVAEIADFRTTAVASTVHAAPDSSAPILENVRSGLRIFVTGEVAGGWIEIPMKRGGLGYIPASDLR